MEEDSVPEIEGGSGASPFFPTPGISFVTTDGTLYNISGACGRLGDNVQLGSGQMMVINSGSRSKRQKNLKPQKPISQNQDEPNRELLERVSQKLLYEEIWKLGRNLKLSDTKLDEIKVNYNLEGAAEIKYQVLAEWIKKDENPTIATLAFCLCKIGRGDIADKLPS